MNTTAVAVTRELSNRLFPAVVFAGTLAAADYGTMQVVDSGDNWAKAAAVGIGGLSAVGAMVAHGRGAPWGVTAGIAAIGLGVMAGGVNTSDAMRGAHST